MHWDLYYYKLDVKSLKKYIRNYTNNKTVKIKVRNWELRYTRIWKPKTPNQRIKAW